MCSSLKSCENNIVCSDENTTGTLLIEVCMQLSMNIMFTAGDYQSTPSSDPLLPLRFLPSNL